MQKNLQNNNKLLEAINKQLESNFIKCNSKMQKLFKNLINLMHYLYVEAKNIDERNEVSGKKSHVHE